MDCFAYGFGGGFDVEGSGSVEYAPAFLLLWVCVGCDGWYEMSDEIVRMYNVM